MCSSQWQKQERAAATSNFSLLGTVAMLYKPLLQAVDMWPLPLQVVVQGALLKQTPTPTCFQAKMSTNIKNGQLQAACICHTCPARTQTRRNICDIVPLGPQTYQLSKRVAIKRLQVSSVIKEALNAATKQGVSNTNWHWLADPTQTRWKL